MENERERDKERWSYCEWQAWRRRPGRGSAEGLRVHAERRHAVAPMDGAASYARVIVGARAGGARLEDGGGARQGGSHGACERLWWEAPGV